jgi:hypothetical protein
VSTIDGHNAIVPRPVRPVDPCGGEVGEERSFLVAAATAGGASPKQGPP